MPMCLPSLAMSTLSAARPPRKSTKAKKKEPRTAPAPAYKPTPAARRALASLQTLVDSVPIEERLAFAIDAFNGEPMSRKQKAIFGTLMRAVADRILTLGDNDLVSLILPSFTYVNMKNSADVLLGTLKREERAAKTTKRPAKKAAKKRARA